MERTVGQENLPDLGTKYRILGELGAGAMGRVYRARHLLLDREVAVKVVAPALLDSDEAAGRFLREARLAARLVHPHIVQVFDVDLTSVDGRPSVFIVAEFVDGPTLADVLRRSGPLEPGQALPLTAQLLQGLAAAHAQGVIHRDVKPENLLLTKAGLLKVADFGIARDAEAGSTVTVEGCIIGTPAYMAPEQVARQDDAPLTPLVDVYAAGAVLYEMLTGQPPFVDDDPMALLTRKLRERPPRPSLHRPRLPPALDACVMAALETDAVHRPTAREFLAQVEELRSIATRQPSAAAAMPTPTICPDVDSGATLERPSAAAPHPHDATDSTAPTGATRERASRPGPARPPRRPAPLRSSITPPPAPSSASPLRRLPVPALGLVLVGLLVGGALHLRPEPGPPPSDRTPTNLLVERPSRRVATFRWTSHTPYRARIDVRRLPDGVTVTTGREDRATTSHALTFEGLDGSGLALADTFAWTLAAGPVPLATGTVAGHPRLAGGPFVYTRACAADVDFWTDVALDRPRLDPRPLTAGSEGGELDVVALPVRRTTAPPGLHGYSITVAAARNTTVVVNFPDLVGARPLTIPLTSETVAVTDPARRPQYETYRRRQVLALIEREEAEGLTRAEFFARLSPEEGKRIRGEGRSACPGFRSDLVRTGDTLVVGDGAGEVTAFRLPEPTGLRWPRPEPTLRVAWRYTDPAPNYDEVPGLALVAPGRLAMWLRRTHPLSGLYERSDDGTDFDERYNRVAAQVRERFIPDSATAPTDEVALVVAPTTDAITAAPGPATAGPAATIPVVWRHGAGTPTVPTQGTRVDWVALPGERTLVGAMALSDATRLRCGDEVFLLSFDDTRPLELTTLLTLNRQALARPVQTVGGLVAVLGSPTLPETLPKLRTSVGGVLHLLDPKDPGQPMTWPLRGTPVVASPWYDRASGRMVLADHRTVYLLDAAHRERLLRSKAMPPSEPLPDRNERIIDVSELIDFPQSPFSVKPGSETCIVGSPILLRPTAPDGTTREILFLTLSRSFESTSLDLESVGRDEYPLASFWAVEVPPSGPLRHLPLRATAGARGWTRYDGGRLVDMVRHILRSSDDGRVALLGLPTRILALDTTRGTELDPTTGLPACLLVDQTVTVRPTAVHWVDGAVYYTDRSGELNRVAVSPTRLVGQ